MFLLQEGLNENTDPTSLKCRHSQGDILRESKAGKSSVCTHSTQEGKLCFAPFFYFVTDWFTFLYSHPTSRINNNVYGYVGRMVNTSGDSLEAQRTRYIVNWGHVTPAGVHDTTSWISATCRGDEICPYNRTLLNRHVTRVCRPSKKFIV